MIAHMILSLAFSVQALGAVELASGRFLLAATSMSTNDFIS